MVPFLPYGRQTIEDDDVEAVAAVLRGDWLTTGPALAGFEAALCAAAGARHAVACANGTAGLHLAALALGLGPDDSVIVPSVTFLATANAARYVGAEVAFADVDPDTALIDVAHVRRILASPEGRRVRAIFPVHMAGQPAALAELRALADQHGLAVVDDACHALGTRRDDGGTVGDGRFAEMTVLSFHPVKTVTTGEGGAVLTPDPALHARLCRLRSHGMVRESFEHPNLAFAADGQPNPWYYEMPEPGFNYRLDDIACALGISQLRKLDRFVARRAELVARYDELLAPLAPRLRPLGRVGGCRPGWHLYVALIDFDAVGRDRAAVMNALRDRGVGTQVHYLPVHLQPYYRRRYGERHLPGAWEYYRRCLSLPLHPSMTDDDVARVAAALSDVL